MQRVLVLVILAITVVFLAITLAIVVGKGVREVREARRRQDDGESFAGVIDAHQLRITTGQTIRDLELIANVYEPQDLENRVEYLPL